MSFTTLRQLEQVLVLKQITELGPGTVGPPGRSAYEVAVAEGFVGIEQEWLDSLVGPIGPVGKSNYEVAVDAGFVGTELEWLETVTGPEGPQGPIGPVGPQGVQGIQGEIGPVGPQGPKGDTGPQGIQGIQGIQGEQGIQGVQGEQGPQGNQGIQGETGKTSYQHALDQGFVGTLQDWLDSLVGPQGIQGIQGPVGNTGPQGEKGDKGDTGDTGPKGDKGDKGDTGDTGPIGPVGAGLEIAGSVALYADLPSGLGPGDAGTAYFVEADGMLYIWNGSAFPANGMGTVFQGPQGDPGPPGVDGQDGAPGPKGDPGDPGADGADGLSAYEVAVANGFVGSEQDWLDSFNIITSVNSKTGAVVIDKSDVGLANVDNTSDLGKPISTATQTALDEKVNNNQIPLLWDEIVQKMPLYNQFLAAYNMSSMNPAAVIAHTPDLGDVGILSLVHNENNFTSLIPNPNLASATEGVIITLPERDGLLVLSDDLSAVATSNDYNDLDNKPTIPGPLTPPGATTQVVFNDNGAWGASPNFTYQSEGPSEYGINIGQAKLSNTLGGDGVRLIPNKDFPYDCYLEIVRSTQGNSWIIHAAAAGTLLADSSQLFFNGEMVLDENNLTTNGPAHGQILTISNTGQRVWGVVTANSSVQIGKYATATGSGGVAIGDSTYVPSTAAIAVGNSAGAAGSNTIAIGNAAQAIHAYSAAIGPKSSVSPFPNTQSSGANRMTLGYNEVEIVGPGSSGTSTSLILVSPNGTKFKITVNNSGTLAATAV